LKADIAELLAHNWFLAEQIAENGTSGGAEVRDSYLATITTRLENSLSTPNGQHTLWVGGRGSGVRGRTVNDDKNNPATWGPSDPTLMDGFYWVTGPEGAASTYKDSEGNTGIRFLLIGRLEKMGKKSTDWILPGVPINLGGKPLHSRITMVLS